MTDTTTRTDCTVLAPSNATHYIETDDGHQRGTFTDDAVAVTRAIAMGRLVSREERDDA